MASFFYKRNHLVTQVVIRSFEFLVSINAPNCFCRVLMNASDVVTQVLYSLQARHFCSHYNNITIFWTFTSDR